MGAKMIAASPKNGRASYLIPLFDRETTELVALIDGNRVTATRTAATSAVAVDLLAPERPLRVAVIGSGLEARHHVMALSTIRDLESVAVYSPTAERRAALADIVSSELGVDGVAMGGAREAVAGADVVIAAARSRDESPTLLGAWLEAGMTVVSIGSTLQEQHEVDVEVIRRADLIYADSPDEVADETGDMLDATAAGVEFRGKLHSLQELVAGAVAGRQNSDEILLYKSVGSALQDLAVAELCLRRAGELGIGTALPVTTAPVNK
jgi:ornithine cyclodeaminase/alanine dehydrogenase